MKRLLTLGFIVTLLGFGSWIGAQIEVTTSTVITVASRAVDDTGTYVTPDSVRVVVYHEGVEAFDAWFESADDQCSELNDQLVFFDAFGDIDGGAGTGIYQISANFKKADDEYWINTWYNLVDTTTQTYGSIIYWRADSVTGAIQALRDMEWGVFVDSIDTGAARLGTWSVIAGQNEFVNGSIGKDIVNINAKMPGIMFDAEKCVGTVTWSTPRAAYLDTLFWTLFRKQDYAQAAGTDSTVVAGLNFGGEGNDFYNGMFLTWIIGNNQGLSRLVVDYVDYADSGKFVLYPSLPNAVASAEFFRILSISNGDTRGRYLAVSGDEMDLTSGAETKVYNQSADAFSDSGWTATRAGNMDYLDEAISGLDDNPWDNAKSDTASGMGDWFADWFNSDWWLTATGFSTFDPSSDSTFPDLSHLANRPAIGDTNINPFDPSSDVVVRVTYVDSVDTVITEPTNGGSDTTAIKAMHENRGTSIFNPASDTVTWVDTVLYAGEAQKNTEEEIKGWVKDVLEDTSDVARDATKENYKDKNTITEIREWTWYADSATYFDSIGTMGSGNVLQGAAAGGTGSDTFDIYVFNEDTTAQEGVDICIYNEGKTAKVIPTILTDVNGKRQVILDAGTYPLHLRRLGVIYATWDTITVSNGGADTIWVTSYDPGDAPTGNLTRVKGTNRDFGFNVGERVAVTFSLPYQNVIDTSQNVFINRREITVYSNASGDFEADLIPGVFLESEVRGAIKNDLQYNVKIYAPGRDVFEWNRFDVPDTTGAVWLIDLIR